MSAQIVTLVRHGQAQHNVDEAYHIHDAVLTPLGESQCCTIPARFPADPPINLLVTSPLRRAIQTTLIGFAPAVAAGVPIIALPALQETSVAPCDTGSPAAALMADPRLAANIDYTLCHDGWMDKTGDNAAEPEALTRRARQARAWLRARTEAHVVAVLHGGFLHYLTEDWTGHDDHPGTGWENTEFRSYTWAPGEADTLVETKESRERRADKPLGKTEMMEFVETHAKN